ncbi:MAG TPA: PEP/pyruvate-binding domain-containing protein [Candidatus Udaeobacter sp.]
MATAFNPLQYVEVLGAAAGPADPSVLGGKGASLCRLVNLGHRVPAGFVITRDAFQTALQDIGLASLLATLDSLLADSKDTIAIGEQIQQSILSRRIPSRILEPIMQTVDALWLWEQPCEGVIVRSSATIEDGSAHSFAGIFESIPISTPQEFEPTVREIWASVFSPRALTYFREVGVQQVPAMAVVVQRFLRPERSGVMFTRFAGPDGRPRILVEHVEGDCEKLVKGEVTPERLWLNEAEDVPEFLEGPLRPGHARSLAQLAKRLEESFGAPQDVEWVIHDDALHVVQSRPITAAFSGDASAGAPSSSSVAAILTGVPASSGTGSGPVHLVFNIEQALQLQSGSVLVTPMTNPDMVVAMRNSAAIVTDVGGIICHAAIVSRELGLPCVVGTETATTTFVGGEPITVNGSTGRIYRGRIETEGAVKSLGQLQWSDIWSAWTETTRDRPNLVPIVSTAEALKAMPSGVASVVLVPNLDLRTNKNGLWNDLEALPTEPRRMVFDKYVAMVASIISEQANSKLYLCSLGNLPCSELGQAVARIGNPAIALYDNDVAPFPLAFDPGVAWPDGSVAVPLGYASAIRTGAATTRQKIGGMNEAEAAALDTIKFFGHKPGSKITAMPAPEFRGRWWAMLPEYGRFHQEFATAATTGEFEWLEVRPELVISALLKSLVQPGFEMVPRVLGFRDVPPLHIKWVKCRYHFRSDTFALVWQSIVRATWNEAFMVDLMRRVRASYDRLAEVLILFPTTNAELNAISGDQMVALITSWWPRWVEFFALCWFIQAQGDDILFPFIDETVNHNLSYLGSPPADRVWPGPADFIAPTTPVLSGAYMADVAKLREALFAAGLRTREEAESALNAGQHPDITQNLAGHLQKWHWMRDRDLLFEPWDTRGRVIETALKTEPHAVMPYKRNLQRNMLALSFHFDLAHRSGRALGLNHAARFVHDLNIERENHHILWLKYSYPLRQLVVEIERRLIASGSLEKGDIFFLQAPQLIEAARNLPAPLPSDLVSKVKNRRRGYLIEARLVGSDAVPAEPEDDYY